MSYSNDYLNYAHKNSLCNRKQLLTSEQCACFYCQSVYAPSEIEDWIEDNEDGTAICPKCDVDSVIAAVAGFPITDKEFLAEMHKMWF